MEFEWDPKKSSSNLRKHKVSFEEASTALSDPMAATGTDPDHSIAEFRYVTFGISERGRLLVVAHTEQSETIRIISARLASKRERKIYEEG
ncbi:MAG: BrnT family toxin [bacterium]|mgnify:FL=1